VAETATTGAADGEGGGQKKSSHGAPPFRPFTFLTRSSRCSGKLDKHARRIQALRRFQSRQGRDGAALDCFRSFELVSPTVLMLASRIDSTTKQTHAALVTGGKAEGWSPRPLPRMKTGSPQHPPAFSVVSANSADTPCRCRASCIVSHLALCTR
jgi:hypothetical protein